MGSFLLLALLVFCLLSSLCLFKVWTHSFRLSILRTTPGSYGPCPQPSFVWGGFLNLGMSNKVHHALVNHFCWEEAERRRGDEEEGGWGRVGCGVISCLPSPSPTCPVASSPSASIFCVSPWASPLLLFFHRSLHLSLRLISRRFLLPLTCILSAGPWRRAEPAPASVCLLICLSVRLSDLSPDGGPFCVGRQMRMTFHCKTDTYGEGWNRWCLN